MRLSSSTAIVEASSGQNWIIKRGNSSSWTQPSTRTPCSKIDPSALGWSYTKPFQLHCQNPWAPSFTQLTPLHWRCGSWQEQSDIRPPGGQRRQPEGDAANLYPLDRAGRPGCSPLETGRDTRHPAPSRASNCKQTAGFGEEKTKQNKPYAPPQKKKNCICKHINRSKWPLKKTVKLELLVTWKSRA